MKLGDICEITSGGTPKRSESQFWDGGDIPWVKIGDIKQKHVTETEEFITEEGLAHSAAKLLEPGTLLFSIFASIGAVGILDINAATNQAIAGLKIINSAVERDYLYHWLKAQEAVSKNAGRGVAQNNINLTILRNMEVPILDKEKQRKIVEQFSLIERLIAFAKCDLKHLDKLIKSRFVEMFGDPVNDPAWDSISLRDLCSKLGSGATPKGGKSSYKVSGIPLIRSMNVHNGRFEWKDLAYIDDKQAEKLKGVTLQKGDVLLNITGASVARSCILPDELEGGRVNQHVAIIRADRSLVLPGVLNEILINPSFQNLLLKDSRMAGATREAITKQDLQDLTIPLFPMSLQQQFADFVGQVDKSRFVCALASQRFTLAGVSFESGRHFHTWTPLRMIYVGG